MIKITQIRGKKRIDSNIDTAKNIISSKTYKLLGTGARILRDAAINQLLSRATMAGQSGEDSITLESNWKVIPESNLKVRLDCNSPHAAAVELGTFGSGKLGANSKFWASQLTQNKVGFAVGAQQGKPPHWSRTISPQIGYHYLQTVMYNESIKAQITNDMQRQLDKLVNSIKLR